MSAYGKREESYFLNLILSRQLCVVVFSASPSPVELINFLWCSFWSRWGGGNIYWLYWILISSLDVHSSRNPLISIYLIFRAERKIVSQEENNTKVAQAHLNIFSLVAANNFSVELIILKLRLQKAFPTVGFSFLRLSGEIYLIHSS